MAIQLKWFAGTFGLALILWGLIAAPALSGPMSPESLEADGWTRLTNAQKKVQISGNTLIGVDGSWAAYFHPASPTSDEIRVSSLTSDWTDKGRSRPGPDKYQHCSQFGKIDDGQEFCVYIYRRGGLYKEWNLTMNKLQSEFTIEKGNSRKL